MRRNTNHLNNFALQLYPNEIISTDDGKFHLLLVWMYRWVSNEKTLSSESVKRFPTPKPIFKEIFIHFMIKALAVCFMFARVDVAPSLSLLYMTENFNII